MALIKCPECGKEISDKSHSCIHCGFPIQNVSQHTECSNPKCVVDVVQEVDDIVNKLEDFRLRNAAYYYQTARFTYDAFFKDISEELIQKTLDRGKGKVSEYEAVDMVVEKARAVESACAHNSNYTTYEKFVVEVSNLIKSQRYQFFPCGCCTYWLKNLNYDKLKNATIMQIAKALTKGSFAFWTKGELEILFAKLTQDERTTCLQYWGEKYNPNLGRVNSEGLYNCWLRYKNSGQAFDLCEIEKYKENDTADNILPGAIKRESVKPECSPRENAIKATEEQKFRQYEYEIKQKQREIDEMKRPKKPNYILYMFRKEIRWLSILILVCPTLTLLFCRSAGVDAFLLVLFIALGYLATPIWLIIGFFDFTGAMARYNKELELFETNRQEWEREKEEQKRRVEESYRIMAHFEAEAAHSPVVTTQVPKIKCPVCGSDNVERITTIDRSVSVAMVGLHSAATNGRWCGDQRPPCGLKTAG